MRVIDVNGSASSSLRLLKAWLSLPLVGKTRSESQDARHRQEDRKKILDGWNSGDKKVELPKETMNEK